MSADRAQNSRNANSVALWVKDEVNALLRVQWSHEQIASQLPVMVVKLIAVSFTVAVTTN